MKPKVIIVGVGETGGHLARRLCENWDVIAIDSEPSRLERPALAACEARIAGDGTSALVLRNAGAAGVATLVAATSSDEVNLEVLRVARQDFSIENLYAIMLSTEHEERYQALGATVVDRHMSCSALLESRLERRKVATSIGLGEGEIVEVQVMANSSVIGHRLADLSPRRWLVGAVYRDGELIVPHGDTVIEEGDRVVVIGDPEILSSIATHIGTGESEFPLHYGSKIVALDTPGLPSLLGEAHYLLHATAASHFEVITGAGTPPSADLLKCCEDPAFSFEVVSTAEDSPIGLATVAAHRDAGLLLLDPAPMPFLARIGLSRTQTVRFIDLASSPVLISRGTFPYERVLLVLAELPFDDEAARLAIDLVRMVGGSLSLGVVHLPELVVGSQLRREIEDKRREIENLADLYHVGIKLLELHGNPINVVVEASREFNLVVMPYTRRRRSSLTRPDVGLNLLHQVRCSALVMPSS